MSPNLNFEVEVRLPLTGCDSFTPPQVYICVATSARHAIDFVREMYEDWERLLNIRVTGTVDNTVAEAARLRRKTPHPRSSGKASLWAELRVQVLEAKALGDGTEGEMAEGQAPAKATTQARHARHLGQAGRAGEMRDPHVAAVAGADADDTNAVGPRLQ